MQMLHIIIVLQKLIFGCAAVSIHPTTCSIVSERKNGSKGTACFNKKNQKCSSFPANDLLSIVCTFNIFKYRRRLFFLDKQEKPFCHCVL
jgi:hypothetical protein